MLASMLFTRVHTRRSTKVSSERRLLNRLSIINAVGFTAANSQPTTITVHSPLTEIWHGDGRAAHTGAPHSSSSAQKIMPSSKSIGSFSITTSVSPHRLALPTLGTTGRRRQMCFMEADFDEASSTPRACPITEP